MLTKKKSHTLHTENKRRVRKYAVLNLNVSNDLLLTHSNYGFVRKMHTDKQPG